MTMKKPVKSKTGRASRIAHQRLVMPVCYKMSSTDTITWGNAVGTEGTGEKRIVRFDDGGWNYAKDCFFTEVQCRRYHKIPPKDWKAVNLKVADRLEKLAEQIRA